MNNDIKLIKFLFENIQSGVCAIMTVKYIHKYNEQSF
jgi:hypothetical protein